MTTTAPANTSRSGSSADGVHWNLADLYASAEDPHIGKDLAAARERAKEFESLYRGQIDTPGGPSTQLLLTAVRELESLSELMDKPLVYAHLLHAARTDEPRHGALLSRTQQERIEINQHLIFFDLEWIKVADDVASRLMADHALARYRHWLEQKRAWKPHYLTEPEEKILDEKTMTGRAAFVRLFDESVASIQFPYEHNGESTRLTLQQLNAKLYDADRSVRRDAALGITRGLQENTRLLSYIFNTLVLDHRTDCRLRRWGDNIMGPRHLANEISAEVVDALMTSVERYHGTVQRYYRLKGRLLGLEQLHDYDRYAPLSGELPSCPWKQAREIVQGSYEAFSPEAGKVIRHFFDHHWIDAELRSGKRSGAFSSSAVPSVHPYILMNFTDKLRDVMTLAHELGHGLHQYLSRRVGYLQCDTPLTTAETASVFGEMLTFQQLLRLYQEPKVRLALLCSKIEDGFATVFRQVVLTRFEQSLHQARHKEGELTTERVNELWMQANRPMHGDVVQLSEGYAWWWLYIGHFIHVPFYCYAYSFGELLVLALVQKYKQEGAKFVPRYLEMLSAGGSLAPPELLARLGIDINDPKFWELGLRLLDDMVSEAEQLARQA
jgi:oligoendopeptidase F